MSYLRLARACRDPARGLADGGEALLALGSGGLGGVTAEEEAAGRVHGLAGVCAVQAALALEVAEHRRCP
ncbi:hypothetical protein GCM10018785_35700 [Streptomyces longispororuber]|uniref:Uncharacterized protein n=1 Tax=Streptomyces longispororuber TaxID=68230 RepID=A0A918ZRH7_9ACTN|nr:hypothetical protein [Streptomyces longispororuber]GHE63679.1 hypothetical protein GCM10018785_35700 [Streptomyces longispororuber]